MIPRCRKWSVLLCFSMSAPVGLLWWCPIVLGPGCLAMILRLHLRSGPLRGRDSLLLLPAAPRSLLVELAYLERFAFILQGMWDPCRTPLPLIRLLGPLKVPVPPGGPLHKAPGVILVRSTLLTFPSLWWNISLQKEIFLLLKRLFRRPLRRRS